VKTTHKTIATIAILTALAGGATGCSNNADAASTPAATTTAPAADKAPAEVVKTIEGFVAATTSDQIAKDLPDHVTADTFTPALAFVDMGDSDVTKVKKAISDFALVKVADAKTKIAVVVDPASVKVDGDTATVPADKITVNAGDKKAADSDNLAKNVTTLKYTDGAWKLAYPKDAPKPTETPAATGTATPTPSATK